MHEPRPTVICARNARGGEHVNRPDASARDAAAALMADDRTRDAAIDAVRTRLTPGRLTARRLPEPSPPRSRNHATDAAQYALATVADFPRGIDERS